MQMMMPATEAVLSATPASSIELLSMMKSPTFHRHTRLAVGLGRNIPTFAKRLSPKQLVVR